MQDWITGTFAVLGTLLVLAGATLIVLRTLGRLGALPDADTQPLGGARGGGGAVGGGGAHSEPATEPTSARRWVLRRLSPASQLIVWGVLLLVLAALTVGMISFGFSLEAGTGTEGTP